MAPTPHHPLHLAGACKDAAAHPQHGHHRTTSCTTCSVRSPGMCTPQASGEMPRHNRSRSALSCSFSPIDTTHLVPPFYARWSACRKRHFSGFGVLPGVGPGSRPKVAGDKSSRVFGQASHSADFVQVLIVSLQFSPPGLYRFRQFAQHRRVAPSRALQHMKRMIRRFNDVQRRSGTQLRADGNATT